MRTIFVRDGITVSKDALTGSADLTTDSRTFLYSEVFTSMINRNSSFLFGQGAGTGYDSRVFRRSTVGQEGRFGSEVGFLNTLMYSGLVGAALNFAILCLAIFYGLNRSSNDVCKLFALFLVFKWILFFVEEIPMMDLNNLVTWAMVGVSLSKKFRSMDNQQIRELLRRGPSLKLGA